MNTHNLTETINNKINDLKIEVNRIPGGGGLEILKIDLQNIQSTINSLIKKINKIEYSLTGLDPNRF